jgi:fatty acid desaturase
VTGVAAAALAAPRRKPYVIGTGGKGRRHRLTPVRRDQRDRSSMAQRLSTTRAVAAEWRPRRVGSALVAGGAALAAALLVGALLLWFQHGTTVFFEMIATGIAGCL